MNKSKVLTGMIMFVYAAFVFFQFSDYHYLAAIFDALILPLITVKYFLGGGKKQLLFVIFLVFYSISDLMVLIEGNIPPRVYYYVGNGFYMIAYLALIIKILKSFSFLEGLKNFKLYFVVLIVLDIYIAYVLQIIIEPYASMDEYVADTIYNILMLTLIPVSLLNYFYKENKKSLFMFLGSLFIVFSEVITVAYLYVREENLFNFLTTTLTLLALYFFCRQSKLVSKEINQLDRWLAD